MRSLGYCLPRRFGDSISTQTIRAASVRYRDDRSGATAVEYVLIAGILSGVLIAALTTLDFGTKFGALVDLIVAAFA